MGTVTYLADRSRACAPPFAAAPFPGHRVEDHLAGHIADHIKEALDRYRREVRLMLGRQEPSSSEVDGVVILDRFRASRARRRVIGDRIVRIKTLEAMLELVLEGPDAMFEPSGWGVKLPRKVRR